MDFYLFEDSSDHENLPSLDIEWTLILQFCFFDYLKLCFLLDASIFTTIYEKKEEQKDVTKEKNAEIPKHSQLSIIWISKKLNSLKSNYSQTTFKAKLPSEQNLEKITFNNSNSHCLEQICFIDLSLFGSELSRVNYSCSHFFSLASSLGNYLAS